MSKPFVVQVGTLVAFEYTTTTEANTAWGWTVGTVLEEHPHKRLVTLGCWDPPRRDDFSANHAAQAKSLSNDIDALNAEIAQKEREASELTNRLAKDGDLLAQRRRETEEKLEFVRPALEEARLALNQINAEHLRELRSYTTPPETVKKVLEAVTVVMGSSAPSWEAMRTFVRRDDLIPTIRDFDPRSVTPAAIAAIEKSFLPDPNFTQERASRASRAAGPMYLWVIAQIKYAGTLSVVSPLLDELRELEKKFAELEAERNRRLVDISQLQARIKSLSTTRDELMYGTPPFNIAPELVSGRSRPGEWHRVSCTGHIQRLVILRSSILRVLNRGTPVAGDTYVLTVQDTPRSDESGQQVEAHLRTQLDETNAALSAAQKKLVAHEEEKSALTQGAEGSTALLEVLRKRAEDLEREIENMNVSTSSVVDQHAVAIGAAEERALKAEQAHRDANRQIESLQRQLNDLQKARETDEAKLQRELAAVKDQLTTVRKEKEAALSAAAAAPRHVDPAKAVVSSVHTQTDEAPPKADSDLFQDDGPDDDLVLDDEESPGRRADDEATDDSGDDDKVDEDDEAAPVRRPMRVSDIERFSYLAAAFPVEKVSSAAMPFGGQRMLRRTWIVDMMRGVIHNCSGGSASKSFPVRTLAMVERDLKDTLRLRVMFCGFGHDHDVRFQSAFARERFVELVQCIRTSVVVYSPFLAGTNERSSVVISLQDAPSLEVDVGGGATLSVGGPSSDVIRIEASQRLTQNIKVWCGSHNLDNAAQSNDSEVLDSWLPRGTADLYAVGLHGCPGPTEQSVAIIEAHLGPDFVPVATLSSPLHSVLVVYVRATLLGAVSNSEGTMVTLDSSCLLAIGTYVYDTPFLFACFLLGPNKTDEQRVEDMVNALSRLQVWSTETDSLANADQVFAFGEFNFSIDADEQLVSSAVGQNDFGSIVVTDAFNRCRKLRPSSALSRFEEPPINFAPTAFTESGPKYATRCLHFSPAGYKATCTAYDTSDFLVVSQYLPVAALYKVAVRRPAVVAFEIEHEPVYRLSLASVTLVAPDDTQHKNLVARVSSRVAGTQIVLKNPLPSAQGMSFIDGTAQSFDLTTHLDVPLKDDFIRLSFVDEGRHHDDARVIGTAIVKLRGRVGQGSPTESTARTFVYRNGGIIGRCVCKLRWSVSPMELFDGVL